MSSRNIVLSNGEYYHVFNRGVDRRRTFVTRRDNLRFLRTLDFYRFDQNKISLSKLLQSESEGRENVFNETVRSSERFVDIIAYVLMPNHFHLILRQLKDRGITTFMSKFTNSYTKYFNTRHGRVGDLFQGVFKAVHIQSDEQIMHLSRYIHLNPFVSRIVELDGLLSYEWSSLPEYCTEGYGFIEPQIVLHNFKNREKYKQFVLDHSGYAKRLEEIKHLTLD